MSKAQRMVLFKQKLAMGSKPAIDYCVDECCCIQKEFNLTWKQVLSMPASTMQVLSEFVIEQDKKSRQNSPGTSDLKTFK